MGGGLLAGLSNEDAARFAFLLATPIIGAAAVLKLPDLFGSDGDGVRGQALVAALCAALTAYLSVRFLMRYFQTNTADAVRRLLRGCRHGLLDLPSAGSFASPSALFGPDWNQAKMKQPSAEHERRRCRA